MVTHPVWRLAVLLVVCCAPVTFADDPLSARIDQLIETRVNGKVAGPASDAEFLRRIYLDLNGIVPAVAQVKAFLAEVGGVRSLAYDPGRDLLACGGMTNAKSNAFCPGDPLVVLIDGKTGAAKQQLKPKIKADGPINGLQFLSDGLLAGIGEGAAGASLSFWNVEQSAPIYDIKMNSGYEVDLHPDGWQLAVSRFETNGRGGNGRHSTPEAYVSNDGVVDIYQLYEKPMEKPAEKPTG